MTLKTDNYWVITGDATPDSVTISVQAEDDPEVGFSWELSKDCSHQLIESLMMMTMDDESFELVDENDPASIAKLWVRWLENNRSFSKRRGWKKTLISRVWRSG